MLRFADVDSEVQLVFGAIELGPNSSLCSGGSTPGERLEFGRVKLGPTSRVNVAEAHVTLTLRARRNTQLLAQALSVISALIKFMSALVRDGGR